MLADHFVSFFSSTVLSGLPPPPSTASTSTSATQHPTQLTDESNDKEEQQEAASDSEDEEDQAVDDDDPMGEDEDGDYEAGGGLAKKRKKQNEGRAGRAARRRKVQNDEVGEGDYQSESDSDDAIELEDTHVVRVSSLPLSLRSLKGILMRMRSRRNRKRIEEALLLPLDQQLKPTAKPLRYLNPRKLEQRSSSNSLPPSLRSTQLRPTPMQKTSHIEQLHSLKLSKRNCSAVSANPTIKESEHLERNTHRNSDPYNST